MIPDRIYIDANLLVLLVVGTAGKDRIARHRRLTTYEIEDYERLVRLVSRTGTVLVTPNILTRNFLV